MKNLLLIMVLVVWTWTTPDGTVWFTDDEERIPSRFVDEAKTVEVGPITEYRKFTPILEPVDGTED